MAHLSTIVETRELVNNLNSKPHRDHVEIGSVRDVERVALKLAEIHSNLAIVEAIDDLKAEVGQFFAARPGWQSAGEPA